MGRRIKMREMFMELLVCLLETATGPPAGNGGPLPCERTGGRERKGERACLCPRGQEHGGANTAPRQERCKGRDARRPLHRAFTT